MLATMNGMEHSGADALLRRLSQAQLRLGEKAVDDVLNGNLGQDGSSDAQGRLWFAVNQCSLGAVLVAASAKGVAAILLGDDSEALTRDLQNRFSTSRLTQSDPGLEALLARVVALLEAPHLGHNLPLDVRGTAFQRKVWQALREIPPGATATYGDIATRLGAPAAVRAVAGACAANSLAVAIPCHRVVRQDGALSGYRWGAECKRALLAREA